MSTRLTPHFTREEMVFSQTALRLGIRNTPSPKVWLRLANLARNLEDVRAVLGDLPLPLSSAYRSPALNRAVGGSENSDHCRGDAADFSCPKFGSPLQVAQAIEASDLRYDQLIHEFGGWVHISFGPRMRQQTLTIDRRGTRVGLHPVR